MGIHSEQLVETLQDLEWKLSKEWGLNKISGGFVHLKYNEQDDKYIYLTCRAGVQNDVDNDVQEEEMKLDIKTLRLI